MSGTASAAGGSHAGGFLVQRMQPFLEAAGHRPELSSSQALPCLWVFIDKCVGSQVLPGNREL